ncbi:MAG: immunoglobulin-like domain-containing protein [Lachnospiraceae bacterium]
MQRRKILKLAMLITVLFACFLPVNQVSAAGSPYWIKINKGTNVVTVYKQDKNGKYKVPHKAFICSVGNATPVGTFYIPYKMRWGELMGPSYGQYCSVITGDFLFHSVWYYQKTNNSLSYTEYNKLGTTASHGCVRLTCIDAKWIYDNCPTGTGVTIFNGTSKNDPLGKPKALKLSGYTGWDPTDPDPNNPYAKYRPVIEGAKNQKVTAFTKFKPQKGVTARSSSGKKLTRRLQIDSKVNMKRAGKYPVTYSVEDDYHRITTKMITVTVVDKTKPIIKGAVDRVVEAGSRVNLKEGVKAYTKSGDNVTKSIEVITDFDSNKPANYRVKYRATGKNGRKASVVVNVTVLEATDIRLVLNGVEDLNLTYSDPEMTEEEKMDFIITEAMKHVTAVIDGKEASGDAIQTTVKKKTEERYLVTYKIKDAYGYTMEEEAVVRLTFLTAEDIIKTQ